VADLLGTDCITMEDYKPHGQICAETIARRVGSWKCAIEKSGLKLSPHYNETITDDELFENLEQLWEKLARQPSRKDFIKPFSRYSYDPYPRRFGTYRKASEAFVASFEQINEVQQDLQENSPAHHDVTPSTSVHKTSRNVSWRMRFLVMRRDYFKCRLCGLNPAMNPGTVLVVDHTVPWASGGETVMNNLQTLCEQCNGGKSNLPIKGG
jgi:predicted restriction endonuclease